MKTNQPLFTMLIATGMFLGMSLPLAAQDAAGTYSTKCVACHAVDGGGSATGKKLGAHDFRTADVQKMSDAELTEVISTGKNKMPAYGKSLKPGDIQGLVAFIRKMAPAK